MRDLDLMVAVKVVPFAKFHSRPHQSNILKTWNKQIQSLEHPMLWSSQRSPWLGGLSILVWTWESHYFTTCKKLTRSANLTDGVEFTTPWPSRKHGSCSSQNIPLIFLDWKQSSLQHWDLPSRSPSQEYCLSRGLHKSRGAPETCLEKKKQTKSNKSITLMGRNLHASNLCSPQ